MVVQKCFVTEIQGVQTHIVIAKAHFEMSNVHTNMSLYDFTAKSKMYDKNLN